MEGFDETLSSMLTALDLDGIGQNEIFDENSSCAKSDLPLTTNLVYNSSYIPKDGKTSSTPNDNGQIESQKYGRIKLGFIPLTDYIERKRFEAEMALALRKPEAIDLLYESIQISQMPVTQGYRLRCYGPPTNYTGPMPSKEAEVFVGNIPQDAFESELVPLFEQIGKIFHLRIVMDICGLNRGYCFAQYFTEEQAASAIILLNNYYVRPDHRIYVLKSVVNRRLFIGGIPVEKTKEEIFQDVASLTRGVVRIFMYPHSEDKQMNRGFAFVEYEDHNAAAAARSRLMAGCIVGGAQVTVDWAKLTTKMELVNPYSFPKYNIEELPTIGSDSASTPTWTLPPQKFIADVSVPPPGYSTSGLKLFDIRSDPAQPNSAEQFKWMPFPVPIDVTRPPPPVVAAAGQVAPAGALGPQQWPVVGHWDWDQKQQ